MVCPPLNGRSQLHFPMTEKGKGPPSAAFSASLRSGFHEAFDRPPNCTQRGPLSCFGRDFSVPTGGRRRRSTMLGDLLWPMVAAAAIAVAFVGGGDGKLADSELKCLDLSESQERNQSFTFSYNFLFQSSYFNPHKSKNTAVLGISIIQAVNETITGKLQQQICEKLDFCVVK